MAAASTSDGAPVSPWRRIPPVTRTILIILCSVYLAQCVCHLKIKRYNIRADRVLFEHQYYRILSSSLLHRNLRHFGLNLWNAYYSGTELEQNLGSRKFMLTTALSMVFTPVTYVLLALVHDTVLPDASLVQRATKGFSGVIFHWSQLECYLYPNQNMNVFFWKVPALWYPWVMTLLLAALDPRSSWLMHTSGILTGLIQGYLCGWRKESNGETEDPPPPKEVDPKSLRAARLKRFQVDDKENEKKQSTRSRMIVACAVGMTALGSIIVLRSRGDMASEQEEEL